MDMMTTDERNTSDGLSVHRSNRQEFKIVQEGEKTYVIIVKNNKQNETATFPKSNDQGPSLTSDDRVIQGNGYTSVASIIPHFGLSPDLHVPQPPSTPNIDKELTKDNVKRNLANIGGESDDEDFYTNPSRIASVFGVHDGVDPCAIISQTTTSVNLRNSVGTGSSLSRTQSQNVQANINNVCPSRKLFSSPLSIPQTPIATLYPIPLDKTPNTDSHSAKETPATPTILRYAYKTRTPELPNSKTGAMRKIFIIQESPSYKKSASKKVCQTPEGKSIGQVGKTWHKPCTPSSNTKPKMMVTENRPKLPVASASKPNQPQVVIVSRHGIKTCENNYEDRQCASATPSIPKTVHIHISQVPETCNSATKNRHWPDQACSTEESSGSLDDSLTNIQWLRGLASDGLVTKTNKKHIPKGAEIERVSQECGRNKRPSYSYMMLIQMALNSRADKLMTLREICKWIEDTFPFYKHTAKPGWKNSIRHNLSVYEMFVRVPSKPKKHGSQWTVKENCSKKPKPSKTSAQNKGKKGEMIMNELAHLPGAGGVGSNLVSFLPMFNSSRPVMLPVSLSCNHMPLQTPLVAGQHAKSMKRKGPMPILPRPPLSTSLVCNNTSTMAPPGGPVQAYALIPLQSLQGSMQPPVSMVQGHAPPMILPAPVHPVTCTTISSLQDAPISTGVDPVTAEVGHTGHSISCRPDQPVDRTEGYTTNMIKEAWQKASCMEGKETQPDVPLTLGDTTTNEQPRKRVKVKPGLPKPKMYHKPRSKSKMKRQVHNKEDRESKNVTNSSTPLNPSGNLVPADIFLDDIENGLPTPLRQLLDTSSNQSLSTSTPFKAVGESPKWLSPIHGFTPVRHSFLADGSFLDFLPANMEGNSPPLVTPIKSLEAWMKIANGLMDTPNASLIEISPAKLSPCRSMDCSKNSKDLYPVQSISGLLAEIDPCLVDDLDNVQLNLSTINYQPANDIGLIH